MFFTAMLTCQVKMLNALGKTYIPLTAVAVSMAFHPLWCYILVTRMHLDIVGIGIADVITNFSMLAINILYTAWSEETKEVSIMPDRRMFQGIKEYFEIGIPSTLEYALDVWAGSMVVFAAGYIDVKSQAAFIILFNLMVLLYMLAVGLQQASNAIVGQLIGKNDIEGAKVFFSHLKKFSLLVIFGVMIMQYTFRVEIIQLYTNEESVQLEALAAIPVFVFHILPDLYKGMLRGVISALGIQKKAVYVHLAGHWGIYPLFIYIFTFKYNMRVAGIVLAKTLLEYYTAAAYTLII